MPKIAAAIAALALSIPVGASPLCNVVQPTELISPSAIGYAHAGFSVAAAGDIVVVGAYGDETQVVGGGSVTVYRLINGIWQEETQLLPPTPHVGDWFGYSVATDGVRIVVGVPYGAAQGVNRAGHVIVYRREPSLGWVVEQELSNPVFQDRFGASVDIDADRIIVGAPGRDFVGQDAGGADIFVLENGVWNYERDLIIGSLANYANAGHSVAIDLPHAIIGAPRDSSAAGTPEGGAVYAFELSETGWGTPHELIHDDSHAEGGFGWSVAVDDGTAVTGSPYAFAGDAGMVNVFGFDNGTWNHVQRLLPAYGPWDDDHFGEAVALDGDRLIAGGPGRGSIAGYIRINGTWELGTDFLFAPDDLQTRSFFGTAVGISEHAVIVGADSTDVPDTNAGSAFVYAASCSCRADLAPPSGVLNIFDIVAYIDLYNAADVQADLAEPFGTINFFDIVAYVDLYNAGCP